MQTLRLHHWLTHGAFPTFCTSVLSNTLSETDKIRYLSRRRKKEQQWETHIWMNRDVSWRGSLTLYSKNMLYFLYNVSGKDIEVYRWPHLTQYFKFFVVHIKSFRNLYSNKAFFKYHPCISSSDKQAFRVNKGTACWKAPSIFVIPPVSEQ